MYKPPFNKSTTMPIKKAKPSVGDFKTKKVTGVGKTDGSPTLQQGKKK